MKRFITVPWGLFIGLLTQLTRYIYSTPSAPPLNVDWITKRIPAARNAGLLQLLLLAAATTMAFQVFTIWSDANDALGRYVEYIIQTLPYNGDGNTSIADSLSKVNPASSPNTSNWYSISLLGDRRWFVKVDTLPRNALEAWLARDGTQSCPAQTIAIVHMTSTMPSINRGNGFFNNQYLVANGTALPISVYSGAAFTDMMLNKHSGFA